MLYGSSGSISALNFAAHYLSVQPIAKDQSEMTEHNSVSDHL